MPARCSAPRIAASRRRSPAGPWRSSCQCEPSKKRCETATSWSRAPCHGLSLRRRTSSAPPGVLELEELLSNHLDTRVRVNLGSRKGKVVIEFASLEDLERIYRVMTEAGTHQEG